MKVRIEISDNGDEEVVIRTHALNDEVRRICDAVNSVAKSESSLALSDGKSEFFVALSSLLFFEAESGRTTAHTADRMFYVPQRLYELERILPRTFARVSKSCVVNTALISSISRNPMGASETHFSASYKKVYISRSYYKAVRQLIETTRLQGGEAYLEQHKERQGTEK